MRVVVCRETVIEQLGERERDREIERQREREREGSTGEQDEGRIPMQDQSRHDFRRNEGWP